MSVKTNRLPVEKHEVSGCSDCPLRTTVVDSHAFADTHDKCGHPDVPERDVTDEEGVPDFCPLLRNPLLLVLAKPEGKP